MTVAATVVMNEGGRSRKEILTYFGTLPRIGEIIQVEENGILLDAQEVTEIIHKVFAIPQQSGRDFREAGSHSIILHCRRPIHVKRTRP